MKTSDSASYPLSMIAESVLIIILAFLFFTATGSRDVLWGDPSKTALYTHDFFLTFQQEGHVGHVLWAKLFSWIPIEPYMLRLQLSSAVAMALALGLAYRLLLSLQVGRWPARLGIAAVSVAHTLWYTAAMLESYPLMLLILTASIHLLLIRRSHIWSGIVLGAGVLVHPLCLFSAPAMLYGTWRSERGLAAATRLAAAIAVGVLLPSLALSGFQGNSVATPAPDSVNWLEAMGRYASLTNPAKNLPLLLSYMVYNFASPALILLALGIVQFKGTQRQVVLIFLATHYLFALFWLPQRSLLVPIPIYFVSSYWIARGAEKASRAVLSRPHLLLATVLVFPPLVYALAPPVATAFGLTAFIRDAPYRDEASYFLRPWKYHETSAREYIQRLEETVPPNSALVGDWTLLMTLKYAKGVENWRPDLVLIESYTRTCRRVTDRLSQGLRIFLLDDERGYYPSCLLKIGTAIPTVGVESLFELVPAGG